MQLDSFRGLLLGNALLISLQFLKVMPFITFPENCQAIVKRPIGWRASGLVATLLVRTLRPDELQSSEWVHLQMSYR